MKRRGRAVAALTAIALAPRTAHGSVFGEENAALAALVAQGIEELTQISTIIQNLRGAVQTANEMLAIAREARRVYEMVAPTSSLISSETRRLASIKCSRTCARSSSRAGSSSKRGRRSSRDMVPSSRATP